MNTPFVCAGVYRKSYCGQTVPTDTSQASEVVSPGSTRVSSPVAGSQVLRTTKFRPSVCSTGLLQVLGVTQLKTVAASPYVVVVTTSASPLPGFPTRRVESSLDRA